MGTLRIGRIVLTHPPETWRQTNDTHTITGTIRESVLAKSKASRDGLHGHVGQVVPVVVADEPALDGYYRLLNVYFTAEGRRGAFQGGGKIPYSLTLDRFGTEATTGFWSKRNGTVLVNAHSFTTSTAEVLHAVPEGHYGYDIGGGAVPTPTARLAEGLSGGDLDVYIYTGGAGFTEQARWACPPANYFNGAARVAVDGHTRTGTIAPNTPDDWELSTGCVIVTPNGTAGRFDVQVVDEFGIPATAKTFQITTSSGEVGAWNSVTILRNTAEVCSIRLVRFTTTPRRLTLDLHAKRGSRTVAGYFSRPTSDATSLDRSSVDAGVDASNGALEEASNDVDGNRYVMGSAKANTLDETNGGVDWAAGSTHDFYVGFVYDYASAPARDGTEALVAQHMGWVSETVTPERR
jgi:hypothetical protein